MEIRSALMVALLASLGLACESSPDDTSGNGGEGDADGVVGERPEQVLTDRAERGAP